MRGVDVRRTWSEKQLVTTFGGGMLPGTPDGMFEDWDGNLTCVQVVRVPIFPGQSTDSKSDTIYETVLAKIIKSQNWMKAAHILPRDFVIFCWLPPFPDGHPEVCAERAQELVKQVRRLGWPFYLKLMFPTEPDCLFPSRFAFRRSGREGRELLEGRRHKSKSFSETELSTFDPTDFDDSDDDETLRWEPPDLFSTDEDWDAAASQEEPGVDHAAPPEEPLPFDGSVERPDEDEAKEVVAQSGRRRSVKFDPGGRSPGRGGRAQEGGG